MNRASRLFDELYVRNLFRQEILPKYSDFVDVGKIAIKPYKKLIWETTYHVVIEYKTVFITREKKKDSCLSFAPLIAMNLVLIFMKACSFCGIRDSATAIIPFRALYFIQNILTVCFIERLKAIIFTRTSRQTIAKK